MLKKTKLCTGLTIALGSAVLTTSQLAIAQAPPTQQLERVEITGSAIRRINAETAVPVTVLKAEDLKKEGVTTVEQIIQHVTASQ
jgi:iron complex outermembrane receptor protein